MKTLNKIQSYLAIADIDYLSARLLILAGIPTNGLIKSAEALEKIIKVNIILIEKIKNKKDLDVKNLKIFNHKLTKAFDHFTKLFDSLEKFDDSWLKYLKMLQDAYSRRYPEHWNEHTITLDINQLDISYTYLRNLASHNFPLELQKRSRDFGGFLSDIYTEEYLEIIKDKNMPLPIEILMNNNKQFQVLEIEKKTILKSKIK